MKKIYYLSTCSTCKKIMETLDLSDFEKLEIKSQPPTQNELEIMKNLSGSYESLFSRRAKLYQELKLKDKNLTESDFLHYLQEHYTFLKRPVVIVDDEIFIGNSAKNIQKLKEKLNQN